MNSTKPVLVEEALEKLRRYCAYQDRCHQEVEQKLRSLGMKEEARTYIVSELISGNFLNEERFSRSFARGKFNQKNWGRLRIVRELKSRGISEFNIRNGLSEIEEEEYLRRFEEVASKAFQDLDSRLTALEKKKKLWNYLSYRGWESELIQEISERLA